MVKLEEIVEGGAFDVVEAVRELARVVVELAVSTKVSTKARSDAKGAKHEGAKAAEGTS